MSGAEQGEFLRAERVCTTFSGAGGDVRAVNDVSFTLGAREALGVVGESGSGKSVLMRSVMGLLPNGAALSDDSHIFFDGVDLTRLSPEALRRLWGPEIAMVFQDPMTSLNPVRSIGAQLTDPLRAHLGLGRRAAADRAADLLAQVGLSDPKRRLRQYPHELSGGMRQRVMIALALSCSPRLLIADEPTTALDVTIQKEILDLLTRLQHDLGMALILISHDLDVVAGRTDRTMVMYAGQVVEHGPTTALFADARHPYTGALMGATPSLRHAARTPTPAIPGLPPDLRDLPSGCSFEPRCSQRQADCSQARPQLSVPPLGGGHGWACFHPLARDAGSQFAQAGEFL